jgi:hypothetical protein
MSIFAQSNTIQTGVVALKQHDFFRFLGCKISRILFSRRHMKLNYEYMP